jgi:hypothetical protein
VTLVGPGEGYERGGGERRPQQAYKRADGLLEQLRDLLAADIIRTGFRGSFEDLYVRLVLLHARGSGRAGAEAWRHLPTVLVRDPNESAAIGVLADGNIMGYLDAEAAERHRQQLSATTAGTKKRPVRAMPPAIPAPTSQRTF